MKNLITIGLPSKGRLKDKSVVFFDERGLKILQSKKERNYFYYKLWEKYRILHWSRI